MKTSNLFAAFLIIFLISLGCSKEKAVQLEPKMIVLTTEQQELVDESNQFGFKLLDGLVKDEPPGKNVFISPLSIELALSMTLNGAIEETNDAMREAMQFSEMEMSDINISFKNLMNELLSVDKKVIAEIANSIWYRDNFTVEQEFVDVNKDYYSAEVKALDFDSPGAKDIINKWVSDKTRKKIPKIIDEINADHVMFLINAIYFKGAWQSEFKPSETAFKPFHLKSGNTKMVPTMMQNETFPYFINNEFMAAELPYGRGNYSMIILLPQQGVEVEDLVAGLNPSDWNLMLEGLNPVEMDLKLPKFRFTYEKKLNDMLTSMGMGIAFSDFADFRGINQNGGLYITEVKHKTFVEVNEEGTEAAAVTSVGVALTSVPLTIDFNVNRPFVFAIREKYTNAILFIGCVQEPLMED
jgi:serine protease inhibitor